MSDNRIKSKVISVIVPVYNAERTLEDTLLSLRNQSYGALEIIVVDDGSTDRSLEIARKYADNVLIQEHKGAGSARNYGAKNALGDILVFTDADCVLLPIWVEKISLNLLEEGVECSGGGYLLEDKGSFMERFIGVELHSRRKSLPKYVNTIVSNNFSCFKDTFFRAGGFPEEFVAASAEDMILSYKISRLAKIIWDHGNPVIHHHRSSIWRYLKQQYVFSRDSFLMYIKFPQLIVIKTHHPKKIYIELAITCFLIIYLLLMPWTLSYNWFFLPLLFFVVMIEAINVHFLFDLIMKTGWAVGIYGAMILVFRDLSWFIGATVGCILFIKYELCRRLKINTIVDKGTIE